MHRNVRTTSLYALALSLAAACGGRAAPATGPAPETTPSSPPSASTQATSGSGSTAAPPEGGTGGSAAVAMVLAQQLQAATQPSSPKRVLFAWQLDEAGAKFRGRGVARVAAPDRIRLDLFGPQGETYLAAALVGETPRVPANVADRVPLPSPALLWGALGVVRPPAGARLLDAKPSGSDTVLRYAAADGATLEFKSRGSVLRSVRRLVGGGLRESIELTYGSGGALQRTEYRDWAAYRTLTLTTESSTDVASFPDETWNPGGAGA